VRLELQSQKEGDIEMLRGRDVGGRKLRAGDLVVVRPPEEILATLDRNGTLDLLPFMPEMAAFCGKPFRVLRRAEKTCAEVEPSVVPHRLFAKRDVVVLEGLRCDGLGHDGCNRGCRIFWKEAWLRPVEEYAAVPIDQPALGELRACLKTKTDELRYFCQKTELSRATQPYSGRRKVWLAKVVIQEVHNGDLSVVELAKLFGRWFWQRLYRAVKRNQQLRGPNRKGTPIAPLGLKPGERVRVKSRAEVVRTLDRKRRNRGMGVCYEMTRCCGKEAEVRTRVERLIDDNTGMMREMEHTVTLQNIGGDPRLSEECLCYNELGDCPRGELMYWREVWLERVSDCKS
jgi:hypothetical protein